MRDSLAITGSVALLEQLAPFLPDDLINELVPPHAGRGRRAHWSSAQLYRLLLLTLLTPAHSFNLMLALLPEQRAWRKFARLPSRYRLPAASQLHDFRAALGVQGLRRINEQLLRPLLRGLPANRLSVGLIDATDLPAASSAFKKRLPVVIPHTELRWVVEPLRPARVGGLSAIKSTPCVSGLANTPAQ
jgi:hypothetical protein